MRKVLVFIGSALLLLPDVVMSQSTLLITPTELMWQDSRARPGMKLAILEGDPTRQGTFVAQAKLPANYEIAPHYHESTERGVVIAGGLYVGLGASVDRSKAKYLPAGSVFILPSLTPHFLFTTEETTIQIITSGPFRIIPAQAQ